MYCPTCTGAFISPFDPRYGDHAEYVCPCGQLLQWDHALRTRGVATLLIGPPEACQHAIQAKPEARMPLP
jgi:hypothetical protein